MPRIPDVFLDCVVYLYPSVADAKAGHGVGATGFLVTVPFTGREQPRWMYVVTANHVIAGGATVIRLNNRMGRFEIIERKATDWVQHPEGDDVAVCAIGLSEDHHQFAAFEEHGFLSREMVSELNFGPGDEIFFVGRFVHHEGTERNLPTVRMGHVAMMPIEPMLLPRLGIRQECFLIEARSHGGYSGSPVVFPIPPMEFNAETKSLVPTAGGVRLVGLDILHIADYAPVVLKKDLTEDVPERVVARNTGLAAVVPAWRLRDALYAPQLVAQRAGDEVAWLKREAQRNSVVELDVSTADGDERPIVELNGAAAQRWAADWAEGRV